MGGGASVSSNVVPGAPHMGKTEAEIVNLMMPVYFDKDCKITKEEADHAKAGWHMILDDTAPGNFFIYTALTISLPVNQSVTLNTEY